MTQKGTMRGTALPEAIRDELADFSADSRLLALSALAVVIGVASAVVAKALVALIQLITNLAYHHAFSVQEASPAGHHLAAWAALIPVAGGVVIGLMARFGSEKIRGHGIPEALEAILIGESRMSPRVAILKPISSAVSIGTGGPFGAEGPIIMTGGAVGSLIAQLFRLSGAERKTLLASGAAGGMTAIFGTPVAAVLLAVELLLFEWKPRSFVPVAVAAATAAAMRPYLIGVGPMFAVRPHPILGAGTLGVAVIVGLLGGLIAVLLTVVLYGFEDLFRRLPLHWMWWPALGGLVVGLAGLVDPRVLGVGYDQIDLLLTGRIVSGMVVSLLVGKALVWIIALASGTSGGVLAPLLIIGGALGAVLAPHLPAGDPTLWVMVSMAAVLGASMAAPLTAMVFMVELTGDLAALPSLLVAVFCAVTVAVMVLRRSILTEKLARRGHHLTREYTIDPLEVTLVEDVMDRDVPTVPADTPVTVLSDRIAAGDPAVTRHHALAIVDEDGELDGIVTRSDLMRALRPDATTRKTVYEAGSNRPIVAYPDETVRDAVARMLQYDIGRVLVVSRDDPRHVVGYLGRAHVMLARRRALEDEVLRDRRWRWGLRRPHRRAPHDPHGPRGVEGSPEEETAY